MISNQIYLAYMFITCEVATIVLKVW